MFIILLKRAKERAAGARNVCGFKEQQRVEIRERIALPVQTESTQSIETYRGKAPKRKGRQLRSSQLSSLRSSKVRKSIAVTFDVSIDL